MRIVTFEEITNKFIEKLREKEILTQEILDEELEKFKKVIEANNECGGLFFDGIVKDVDLDEVKREAECYFSVTVNSGILLSNSGNDDISQWWSSKKKQEVETYYWDRYKTYMDSKINSKVVSVMDIDTDVVMDNLKDPNSTNKFDVKGMVVGNVQSGKTGNYSGLICKAADAGYKFIVIIAGGMNNLRNQTQKRINENFVGINNKNKILPIQKCGRIDQSKQVISLTTEDSDFNKKDADKNTANFYNINVPIVAVIKKNVSSLSNIIKWLEGKTRDGKVANHAMLIIDDESDYASVNYKTDEDPTKINEKIRTLLNLFEKSAYVAYTATPFANIFINPDAKNDDFGEDLFPKDFIYCLDAPSEYSGAKKYFLQNDEMQEKPQVIMIDDYESSFPKVQKKEIEVKELPKSLKEAVRAFLLNIVVRRKRGQVNVHNSMLIHVTRFTKSNDEIRRIVEEYVKHLQKGIKAFGKLEDAIEQDSRIKYMYETYQARFIDIEFSFKELIGELVELKDIIVRGVYQTSKLKLQYEDNNPINVIAVGGVSLSRGFTLEGLSVSYFTRNSLFYDTLMQMARWFGYRKGYENLCKLYIPQHIAENFVRIDEAITDLTETLKEMKELNKTPKDFGLYVKHYPDTQLQITAKNKLKDATSLSVEIRLAGTLKENTVINRKKFEEEKELVKNFIVEINEKYPNYERVSNNFLWRDIDSKLVIELLRKMSSSEEVLYDLKRNFPTNFIIKHLKKLKGNIDVCIFSNLKGEKIKINDLEIGVELRTLICEGDKYRFNRGKVSESNPEKVILAEEKRKDKSVTSAIVRENYMERPLFMIHFIKNRDKNQNDENIYVTFGISFPNSSEKEISNTSILVNSVYIKNYYSRNQDEVEPVSDEND